LLNESGAGVFASSSRNLLYPPAGRGNTWQERVSSAVVTSRVALNVAAGRHDGVFLAICGPTGVGKTSLISQLVASDQKFAYISPYTTRALRASETDKISVAAAEFERMETMGEVALVNELYGVRYGVPVADVLEVLSEGRIPVLDWPVQHLGALRSAYPNLVYAVYLAPPNQDELKQRLQHSGRGERMDDALREYAQLDYWSSLVDDVVTADGDLAQLASCVGGLVRTENEGAT
jgi:guanylate kinase